MPAGLDTPLVNGAPNLSDTQVPDLKADALQNLTKKIQENFSKASQASEEEQVKTNHSKSKRAKGKEINRNTGNSLSGTSQTSKLLLNSHDHKKTPLSASDAKQLQGKKRLRDGQLKRPSNSGRSLSQTRSGKNAVRGGENVKSSLEEDVFALGGSIDDYELVAGAPSDSEMEGDDKKLVQASHNCLGRDLQQFVRGLGIGKVDVHETDHSSMSEHAEEDADFHGRRKPPQSHRALTAPATKDKQKRPGANRSASRAFSHLVSSFRSNFIQLQQNPP